MHRQRLESALGEAFPGMVLNAPAPLCLATTINFSVPGLSSRLLLDLFDAAGLRVSGGSACSASQAKPGYVLPAMGLPDWQTAAAVRLSFGPTDKSDLIDRACERIRACGTSLRASCWTSLPYAKSTPAQLHTRFVVDGACCYLVADAQTGRCVVIDPLPELTDPLLRWLRCQHFTLAAILDTHSRGDHASSAADLCRAVPAEQIEHSPSDGLGWPVGVDRIDLGRHVITRLAIPGHSADSSAYLLHSAGALQPAFVGDTVMPGALCRSEFAQSEPLAFAASLLKLEAAVGRNTLLLPGHDYADRFAATLDVECATQPLLSGVLGGALDAAGFAAAKADLERVVAPTEHRTMACGARVARCDKAN